MIVHEQWTDQLSDYLDGELSAEERKAVDAHLEGCAECTAVLNDLKRVVTRAASVPPRPPQADLWDGIAARIETDASRSRDAVLPFARRESRRFTFTLPQLAAAAALLIAVSGGAAWEVARRAAGAGDSRQSGSVARTMANPGGPDSSADGAPFKPASSEGTGAADFARVETVSMADAQYDAAVADLEKALKADRGRLDASTIAIVEHNLQIIDQAINQARDALVADPANTYLSSHLVEARRRKLDLLRRATALATETN
jgi:anti-sigma factor RsiW